MPIDWHIFGPFGLLAVLQFYYSQFLSCILALNETVLNSQEGGGMSRRGRWLVFRVPN